MNAENKRQWEADLKIARDWSVQHEAILRSWDARGIKAYSQALLELANRVEEDEQSIVRLCNTGK